MVCACCREREANKRNTHFLTDSIIRSCLNLDGSSEREKGLYFEMSSLTHIDFNFQRGTDVVQLEKELGRPATDEEIEKAKKVPYSVDLVFCDQCEKLFTEIEDEFINKILPQLRHSDLSASDILLSHESKIIRLFFYLQIWRSAICLKAFAISESVVEKLRLFILNHKIETKESVSIYHLSITYIETLGGDVAFTNNYIGHMRFQNPFIIIMNDFVIQLYESADDIKLIPFFGINSSDFRNFINLNEVDFKILILHDAQRLNFITAFRTENARQRIKFYREWFPDFWRKQIGFRPPAEIVNEYIYELTKNEEESILNYTPENIAHLTTLFIMRKLNIQ